MPTIDSGLKALLNRATSNQILSGTERKRIIAYVKKDGISQDEVTQVVKALQDVVNGSAESRLDLSTSGRRRSLNRLLGELDKAHALPLDRSAAERPDGSMDWIGALKLEQGGGVGDLEDSAGVALPKKSWKGQKIALAAGGQLSVDGQAVPIDLSSPPSDALLDGLMALLRPGQVEALAAASKTELADELIAQLGAALPVHNEAEGKFRTVVGSMAALGALDWMGPSLNSAQVDKLLAVYGDLPNPMTQALLLRALDEAPLSEAQQTKRKALAEPEERTLLIEHYDRLIDGSQKIDLRVPGGPATQFALGALAFAKKQASIDNVFEGMGIYAKLNAGTPRWDAQEIGMMAKVLETYVDKYPQTAYTYGTFSKEAPKNVAVVENERIVGKLQAGLTGAKPALDGVPLTSAQADRVKALLGGIRNDAAVHEVSRALSEAADMLSTKPSSMWSAPSKPAAPLQASAFELFMRQATRAMEARDGTKDGMIDALALRKAVKAEASGIKKTLLPRLSSLAGSPPKIDGIELSTDAAALVRGLFANNLRSEMSVSNIAGALKVIAEAHGGKVDGAGAEHLKQVVETYKKSWPDAKLFDFNKLGRMASFIVQGKEIPLSTVNGKAVGLAEFYGRVAQDVAASIDPKGLDYQWMAERWAFRAKEAAELLDVVAQQTAEGAGPVAALRKQFPGKKVTVEVTGRSGAHEQFLFNVEGQGRFNQASDGALKKFTGERDPVLFTAAIRDDGAFDLQVPGPGKNEVDDWPLQTTYAVGDSIDLRYKDPDAIKKWQEGEKFATEHKVLHGHIESFGADGTYVVKYKKPDGSDATIKMSIDDIELNNNPHQFSIKGGRFSDIEMNVDKDKHLRDFLKGARAIIADHLPRDGSLLSLSPTQMAKKQRACVAALMAYGREAMKYPAAKDKHPDAESKKYHEIIAGTSYWKKAPLGDLLELKRGVCRHQCIMQHLLMQEAGIDSRLASGAANTGSGNYRGLHIWLELAFADNGRVLSDQTWNDAAIALWDGAYDVDKRRVEMYHRTARYDENVVG